MIIQQWKPTCDGKILFILDEHKAQKTDEIKDLSGSTAQDGKYSPSWYHIFGTTTTCGLQLPLQNQYRNLDYTKLKKYLIKKTKPAK